MVYMTDAYIVFIIRINGSVISKNKAQSVPFKYDSLALAFVLLFLVHPSHSYSLTLCVCGVKVTRWISPAGPRSFHSVIKVGLRHYEPEVGG